MESIVVGRVPAATAPTVSGGLVGRYRVRFTAAASGAVGLAFAATTIVIVLRAAPGMSAAMYCLNAVGVSFLAAGVAAWWQRPDNVIGKLMVAAGAVWFAGNLQVGADPALNAVGFWLAWLAPFIATHLLLVYPHGQLTGRVPRLIAIGGYISYLTLQGCRYLTEGPGVPIGVPNSASNSLWADVVATDGLVFSLAVLVVIARRWATASVPARRLHGPVWCFGTLLPASAVVGVAVTALGAPTPVQLSLILTNGLCLVALPFAFLSGLVSTRLARRRVADLVLALERTPDPAYLRDLLSAAIGDPSLVLGFWSPATGEHVDVDGRPVDVPAETRGGPTVTTIERHGDRLGVLVHDPALAHQPVMAAAVAAARLALDNARLHALLQVRPVETALAERRAIERDLHDGLQPRLLHLTWLAERTGAADLAAEAREAYVALRELARGIYPAVLTERGIAAAVEEHALRCPVPITMDLPAGRWPARVEATAYFVILEAITNATKHAGADAITVRGRARADRLRIEITDNGRGGAHPGGGGLGGLRDRVGALGGVLTVHSLPGDGTRILVELPCG